MSITLICLLNIYTIYQSAVGGRRSYRRGDNGDCWEDDTACDIKDGTENRPYPLK